MANDDSIWNRKTDLIYLVFFLTHIPVMLAFDLTHLYPPALKPLWMTQIRTWYISTYGDRFFYNPPPWFTLYTTLELFMHLPLTLSLLHALLHNTRRLPLLLLVFALETSLTTATCMAEMLSWRELSAEQRGVRGLGGLYGGYLGVGIFMAIDAYTRLDRILGAQKGIGAPVSKKQL